MFISGFELYSRWVPLRSVMLSFDLFAIFTVKCNDSVSFYFLFPCFHFLFVKDQTASFQLKEISVFLN